MEKKSARYPGPGRPVSACLWAIPAGQVRQPFAFSSRQAVLRELSPRSPGVAKSCNRRIGPPNHGQARPLVPSCCKVRLVLRTRFSCFGHPQPSGALSQTGCAFPDPDERGLPSTKGRVSDQKVCAPRPGSNFLAGSPGLLRVHPRDRFERG